MMLISQVDVLSRPSSFGVRRASFIHDGDKEGAKETGALTQPRAGEPNTGRGWRQLTNKP
jgi:hypothetical protein